MTNKGNKQKQLKWRNIMTAIIITAIIVTGIVTTVALSLCHSRKMSCKHKWKIIGTDIKEFYRNIPTSRYSRYHIKIYTLQCQECGEVRIVSDEELTRKFRNSFVE